MRVQGFITFDKSSVDVVEDKIPQKKYYEWENGYINIYNLNLIDSQNSIDFIFQAKAKSSDNTTFSLSSIKDFNQEQFSNLSIDKLLHEIPNIDLGIWYDFKENSVSFLRNPFGTIPLYYMHIPNKFVAFSTNLSTLIRNERVKKYIKIDVNRIIRYCTFKGDVDIDYDSESFYTNIKSVLPGHIFTVHAASVNQQIYLNFDPLKWKHLKSVEEYGAVFRDLLIKSVKRFTFSDQIGSHLSGGLDSSALSAICKGLYADKSLSTFFAATNTEFTNENHHAKEVAEKISSLHYEVTPQENDFELLQLYTNLYGHPECMLLSPSLQGSLMQFAKSVHCDTLLIGHDGDSIVGTGLDYIRQAFYRKDWQELNNLLRLRLQDPSYFSLSANWKELSEAEKLRAIQNDFFGRRLSEVLRSQSPFKVFILYLEIKKHFDISSLHFLTRGYKALLNRIYQNPIPISILKDEIFNLKKTPLKGQSLSESLTGKLPRKFHESISSVYSAQSIIFNEELFALGNYYGIRNSLPFYDKELFELCMATPTKIKHGSGLGREHFREAMKDVLPENVRTRPDKAVFGMYARQAAIRMYNQAQDVLSDKAEVWDYIDKEKFSKTLNILQTDNLSHYFYAKSQFHIVRTISLAVWLDWLRSNLKQENDIR